MSELEYSNELSPLSDGGAEAKAFLDGVPFLSVRIPQSAFSFVDGGKPTEREVDSVAAFVEAAEELEREPFFGPDEKRTFTSGGKHQTFTFGDRFHFRSALISFRRIWMVGETSHFYTVSGILWRHAKTIDERTSLWWTRSMVSHTLSQKVHYPLQTTMTGEDLISLWLNTVFAHGGGKERFKHRRRDFDRHVSECGHAALEYAFRNVVWALGLHYLTMAKNSAKPALINWGRDYGVQPTFVIGAAFGTATRQRTKEGHIIVRRASSEYAADETFDQRLRRLLDRQQFRSLQFIVKNIELGDKNLVRVILKSSSFGEIVSGLDYELKVVEELGENFSEYGDEFRASCGLHWKGKQSRLYMYDLYVITEPAGLEILDAELADLKNVLING